jgi:hypothetical protein
MTQPSLYYFIDITQQTHSAIAFNLEDAILKLLPVDKIQKYLSVTLSKTNKYAYFEIQLAKSEFHLIENLNLSHLNLVAQPEYPYTVCAKEAKNSAELAQYIDFFGEDYLKSNKTPSNYHEIYISVRTLRYRMPNKNIAEWANENLK